MIDSLHEKARALDDVGLPYFRPGSPVYDDMDKKASLLTGRKSLVSSGANGAVRRVQSASTRLLLGIDEQGAFPDWSGCVVARHDRAGNRRARNKLIGLEQGRARKWRALRERISFDDHDSGVQGQRKASDAKRVFILSRSTYAGAQRNGAATWSGDVDPNWQTFRRQVPAGLNYSISGLPYWTTDIGGFVVANPDDPSYRELYIRWFQFGAFCPIFRAHGTRTTTRMSCGRTDRMRKRFGVIRQAALPPDAIHLFAGVETTHEGYSIMRPLVMDFREDLRAQNIGDQFLSVPRFWSIPSPSPAPQLATYTCPTRIGSTFGRAKSGRVAKPLMRRHRSSVFRFT